MTTILVIDDETSVLNNISDALEFEGFDVVLADDGLRGLTIARQRPVDLIVCDIVMPVLDGFAVLRELRATPATAAIPLLFITGIYKLEELKDILEQTQVKCLFKPFRLNEFLALVQEQIAGSLVQ